MLGQIKNYNLRILLHPKELLLKNLGLKQTILKNTFWLILAELISNLLKLFLFIYIARILGATEYGKFSFALAFVSMFLVFSNLGIFKIITREFAKDKEKERDFSDIISLKILLSLGALILMVIGSFFITKNHLIRIIIWILGIEVLLNSFLSFIYAFFRARQKMEYQALGQIIQVVLITALCFFILFTIPSAKNLSWAYLVGALVSLIIILIFFNFKVSPLRLSFDKSIWKNYLLMSYPLALTALLSTIHSHIDSTIMGTLGELTQTGWYNAAQKIVSTCFVPAGLIGISFFPVLSKSYFEKTREKFQKVAQYYFKAIFFLIAPIVIGGIALAPKIIDFVYDPSYNPSIFAFQILILAFGIIGLVVPFSYALIVSNQQKMIFWISLLTTIINVVLNLILIPKFSLYGAAFAILCAFIVNLLLSIKFVYKYTEARFFDLKIVYFIIGVLVCNFLMAFVISYPKIYELYIIWVVLIGILTYFFCFLLFKILWKYGIKRY